MRETQNNFDEMINAVMSDVLPFESWEKLDGESSAAYGAFCAFRDFGPERNIKKALASVEADVGKRGKKYNIWRNWSTQFQWFKRAEAYDVYWDKLKQTERRKTLEAREAVVREVTGKMLQVVEKKLDTMDAAELSQGNVAEWTKTVVDTDRIVLGMGVETKSSDKSDGQLSFNFTGDFKDL